VAPLLWSSVQINNRRRQKQLPPLLKTKSWMPVSRVLTPANSSVRCDP
jgi:hypothetical protein